MLTEAQRLIALANDRLRAGKIGVCLELQGKQDWIYIRGTFPPKPGSGRTKRYQTRIALQMRCTGKDAVKLAEIQARQIGLDLNLGTFDWRKFKDFQDLTAPEAKTAGQWLQEYEAHWWRSRDRSNPSQLNTWRTYTSALRRLPADQPMTIDLIINWIVEHSNPDTEMRRHFCTCGRGLAALAGLPVEALAGLSGKPNYKPINPRLLPSDEEIAATYHSIEEPGWRHLFGLIATYGLRPHEAWRLDYSEFPTVRVADWSKTGARPIVPLYPEWAEQWRLHEPVYPKHAKVDENTPLHKLGTKIKGWANRNIKRSAYDFRHCYTRRCALFGIDVYTSARLMGHSHTIHEQVYRSWIGEKVVLDLAMRKAQASDRPKAPTAPDSFKAQNAPQTEGHPKS